MEEDLKYPDCFKTHEDCIKCQNFGKECTDQINDIDFFYYISDIQEKR